MLCSGSGGCSLGVRVHGSLLAHPLVLPLRQFAIPGGSLEGMSNTHPKATFESQTVTLGQPPSREVRRVYLHNPYRTPGAKFKLAAPGLDAFYGSVTSSYARVGMDCDPYDCNPWVYGRETVYPAVPGTFPVREKYPEKANVSYVCESHVWDGCFQIGSTKMRA